MASGSPSTPAHTWATHSALPSLRGKPGRAWRARSTNSATASEPANAPPDRAACGNDIGGTGQTASPSTPSRARLVANTTSPGAACSSAPTISAQPPSRCSQLSSTTSARREARYAHAA